MWVIIFEFMMLVLRRQILQPCFQAGALFFFERYFSWPRKEARRRQRHEVIFVVIALLPSMAHSSVSSVIDCALSWLVDNITK